MFYVVFYVRSPCLPHRPASHLPAPASPFLARGNDGGSGSAGGKRRKILLVNKEASAVAVAVQLRGAQAAGTGTGMGTGTALLQVLEGTGDEPGWSPPVERAVNVSGGFELGPFAVAVLNL